MSCQCMDREGLVVHLAARVEAAMVVASRAAVMLVVEKAVVPLAAARKVEGGEAATATGAVGLEAVAPAVVATDKGSMAGEGTVAVATGRVEVGMGAVRWATVVVGLVVARTEVVAPEMVVAGTATGVVEMVMGGVARGMGVWAGVARVEEATAVDATEVAAPVGDTAEMEESMG